MDHFCPSQNPPCVRNECRVATQILAGLYPLNFSKFLVSAYQPLNEEERKGLMNIHHLYLTYLIRKLCNDNTKTLGQFNMNEVLLDVDDTDYALLCDIGSAFAECYLITTPIPLAEALPKCFLHDGHDLDLNIFWLESLYVKDDQTISSSPIKRNGLEDDPKLKELREIGAHMDKFFLDKTSLQRALIKQEDIIKMTPSDLSDVAACFTADIPAKSVAVPVAAADRISAPADKMVQPPSVDEKDSGKTDGRSGDHLAEAIKLAVNQKLNLYV